MAGFVVVDLNLPSLVSFFGDRSYLLLVIAAICGLGWLTPLRRLVVAGTLLLVALWLSVCFTPLASRLADGLVRRDAIENADAVFVFASRIQEDGEPTTDAMSRLLKGIELMAAGRAPWLVVSELPPPAGPVRAARARLARRLRAPGRGAADRPDPEHARRGGGARPARHASAASGACWP